MKLVKYISIAAIVAITVGLMCYSFWAREEWETRKRCAGCLALENEPQQRMIGTIVATQGGVITFTEQLTALTYRLIPCDVSCTTKEITRFTQKNVIDDATQKPIYFDIEGKANPQKNEFVYSSVIFLNERIFPKPKEIKGFSFEKIEEKYTVLKEENFKLNESHYAGLRGFLPHYFSEEQLKQPIPLKEATWELSDSALLTIWFIKEQNQWVPIEQYQWQKGMEF